MPTLAERLRQYGRSNPQSPASPSQSPMDTMTPEQASSSTQPLSVAGSRTSKLRQGILDAADQFVEMLHNAGPVKFNANIKGHSVPMRVPLPLLEAMFEFVKSQLLKATDEQLDHFAHMVVNTIQGLLDDDSDTSAESAEPGAS